SELCQLIRQQFPQIPIITLKRRYFNDEEGKQYITDYGLQEDTAGLLFGVSAKYYCLAAVSGTFRHIFENEGYSFANHTVKFVYQGADDSITAKNLELVSNTTNSRTRNTLLGILDHTVTPMGKRLLRMNILQPPCSIDIIRDRLDAIEELSHSEESIFNIQSCLKQLTDLDHTISYLVKIP
ncbi:DNA mismatch repair protein MutS, partial [Mucor mucedo]|uniref:DNA mismatch repair protein MutS n=1 Tax=Mucor mucedo TaxID=29922 RepID=UPI00221E4F7F